MRKIKDNFHYAKLWLWEIDIQPENKVDSAVIYKTVNVTSGHFSEGRFELWLELAQQVLSL